MGQNTIIAMLKPTIVYFKIIELKLRPWQSVDIVILKCTNYVDGEGGEIPTANNLSDRKSNMQVIFMKSKEAALFTIISDRGAEGRTMEKSITTKCNIWNSDFQKYDNRNREINVVREEQVGEVRTRGR